MRITLRQAAAPGERFAEGTFAASVGTTVPVNLGAHRTTGAVLGARAVDGGRAVEVTVEMSEDEEVRHLERALAPGLGGFSVGTSR
jgi:hypothetical protein